MRVIAVLLLSVTLAQGQALAPKGITEIDVLFQRAVADGTIRLFEYEGWSVTAKDGKAGGRNCLFSTIRERGGRIPAAQRLWGALWNA